MTRRPSRRRICVITGTRAEYGLLRTVMRAIHRHPRLELRIIATGMHLLSRFGHTVDEIVADGWTVDARVPMQSGRDDAAGEAAAIGRGIEGIAKALRRLDGDIVVVLGDRIEAFAGAVAGAAGRRCVAHIHGGDRALGDVDDTLRHAITKLAHIHFAATEDAARRIRRLGEERSRIFRVGAPGLDEIRAVRRPSQDWLRTVLGWDRVDGYALVAQHPCGRTPQAEYRDMMATLTAVQDVGLDVVVTYPNSDPGHSGIIRAIRDAHAAAQHAGRQRWFVARSLGRDLFVRLLKACRVLVGNSSAGIIESATAGVPAVNIGPRQTGRERCGPSVIDCEYGRRAVAHAIGRAMRCRPASRGVYGDGHAGRRIARILANIDIEAVSRQKLITY